MLRMKHIYIKNQDLENFYVFFQLLSDFKGENRFMQRIGPDGLVNPLKLKRFQSSIELADRALALQHKNKLRTYSSSLRWDILSLI